MMTVPYILICFLKDLATEPKTIISTRVNLGDLGPVVDKTNVLAIAGNASSSDVGPSQSLAYNLLVQDQFAHVLRQGNYLLTIPCVFKFVWCFGELFCLILFLFHPTRIGCSRTHITPC